MTAAPADDGAQQRDVAPLPCAGEIDEGYPDHPTLEDRRDLRALIARLPRLIAMAETLGTERLRSILEEAEALAQKELQEIGGFHDH